MRSTRDDDKQPEPAEQAAPAHTPPPAGTPTAGLTLEERIARLEQKLVPIIGEL